MSKENRKALGNYGEKLALDAYMTDGYELLEKQYRCSIGEIDLILSKENKLYFVEVRTKTSQTYGSAEESITFKKRETIRKVSQYFLNQHRLQHVDFQFDVITIFINKQEKKAWLQRYAQAF
jgi:putative endonuclease